MALEKTSMKWSSQNIQVSWHSQIIKTIYIFHNVFFEPSLGWIFHCTFQNLGLVNLAFRILKVQF
jgi:hypothetical protein